MSIPALEKFFLTSIEPEKQSHLEKFGNLMFRPIQILSGRGVKVKMQDGHCVSDPIKAKHWVHTALAILAFAPCFIIGTYAKFLARGLDPEMKEREKRVWNLMHQTSHQDEEESLRSPSSNLNDPVPALDSKPSSPLINSPLKDSQVSSVAFNLLQTPSRSTTPSDESSRSTLSHESEKAVMEQSHSPSPKSQSVSSSRSEKPLPTEDEEMIESEPRSETATSNSPSLENQQMAIPMRPPQSVIFKKPLKPFSPNPKPPISQLQPPRSFEGQENQFPTELQLSSKSQHFTPAANHAAVVSLRREMMEKVVGVDLPAARIAWKSPAMHHLMTQFNALLSEASDLLFEGFSEMGEDEWKDLFCGNVPRTERPGASAFPSYYLSLIQLYGLIRRGYYATDFIHMESFDHSRDKFMRDKLFYTPGTEEAALRATFNAFLQRFKEISHAAEDKRYWSSLYFDVSEFKTPHYLTSFPLHLEELFGGQELLSILYKKQTDRENQPLRRPLQTIQS